MAIKVRFNAGESVVTVTSLYQWDYGQVLEIECVEIGTELMEVHFACYGMSEAIVRACQFVDGIGTVNIPDQCLEQTNSITAWLYSVSANQGHTIKTITIPIIGRIRPCAMRDVPPEHIDKYAEAIEEINEAVNAIEKGNITAARAIVADTAKSADTAKNAETATYATSAGSATTAGTANTATSTGNVTPTLVASCQIANGAGSAHDDLSYNTIYLVRLEEANAAHSGICCWHSGTEVNSSNLGDCTLSFVTGGGGRSFSIKKNGANYGNGTLKFYKFGGVSA